MTNAPPAFFTAEDAGVLVPDAAARSPWGEHMLHGRLLAGLAARAAEGEGATEGLRPVRLTVDLFRAAPMEPVMVTTQVVRSGRRVRTAEVSITCAGQEVVRASALMLRAGPEPPGRVWAPEPWSVPGPDQVGTMGPGGEGPGFLDVRPLTEGGFEAVAQKRIWVREVRALVVGEEPSPFVRAVAAADLANPFSNSGEGGLYFINADLTVYLGRLPDGEWLGLEVAGRAAADGISVAHATLYDRAGTIGHCSVAAVANQAFMGSDLRVR